MNNSGEILRVSADAVRVATPHDVDAIMPVLDAAKQIMRSDGNAGQWVGGYPSREAIDADIAAGVGYVMELGGRIVAYFAFIPSPEPTYASIYGGKWLDEMLPYHVVHRIGSLPDVHGVFSAMLEYCTAVDPNLRIDTHRDNKIMQHNLALHGFTYCGIILLLNGDPRLAYQRILHPDRG